jgi:peptidoglycan/xylan/chitin deacetylase (PgdA/CDA1 family)
MKKLCLPLILSLVSIASCIVNPAVNVSDKAPTGKKLCALTFDDGPDAVMTPRVLDRLEKHGVVATFFVIGQLINESTRPVMERAMRLGCEYGNHSWAWDALDTATEEEILESVGSTSKAIGEVTGSPPGFFRPPNLAVSNTMYATINLTFASGVLGYDWEGCNTTAEERAKNVLKGIKDGAIILLHDVQPPPHPTAEALDILIPELKKRGYTFVTLSDLFALKKVKPRAFQKKMWVYVK